MESQALKLALLTRDEHLCRKLFGLLLGRLSHNLLKCPQLSSESQVFL